MLEFFIKKLGTQEIQEKFGTKTYLICFYQKVENLKKVMLKLINFSE